MIEKSRSTPIDHDYGTCENCYAELRIYTGEINPNYLTDLLQVSPDEVIVKGTSTVNSLGLTRTVKHSIWSLSSELTIESRDIRAHIDYIADKLKYCHQKMRDLQEHDGVKMSVFCYWLSKSGLGGGPTLWPEQMQFLSEFNLECSFSVQFESAWD